MLPQPLKASDFDISGLRSLSLLDLSLELATHFGQILEMIQRLRQDLIER
jgi:hypothetical protein